MTKRKSTPLSPDKTAFDIVGRDGESLASLHRRKGDFTRSHRIFVSNFPVEDNCQLCWWESDLVAYLSVETELGKISGGVCLKCLRRLVDRAEAMIERALRKRKVRS